MTDKHLSDPEIQQYALDRPASESNIVAHVEVCETCKSRVKAYQLLFAAIHEQPAPAFNFNLEKIVLARLPRPKKKLSPDNYLLYIFFIVAMALSGTALYLYRNDLANLFDGIAPLAICLIVITVIIVFIALVIDMYKSYQKKISALNL